MSKMETKKLEDCIEKVTYTKKIPKKTFLNKGIFPIVSQENKLINGYWDNKEDVFKVTEPVIVFGDHTQVVKYVDFDFVLGADGVKILRPIKDLDSRYLYYFLKSINLENLGYSRHYRLLKEIEVTFPNSLIEQKRIVKILDEVFENIEEAKENTQKNLKNIKELFESYLNNIFKNPNKGWVKEYLKCLTIKIGSGATPRGGRGSYKETGIALVRSMNVHDRYFKEKNIVFIDNAQALGLANVTLEKGDVLLNITGASVARSCVIPEKSLPGRVNQHVSIIRPIQSRVDAIFLNYLLTSKPYKDRLLKIGGQGATRQAITKAQLEELMISLPRTVKEQEEFVTKLDVLSLETKKLEEIYIKKLEDLEELKKSILQKAFNGEL